MTHLASSRYGLHPFPARMAPEIALAECSTAPQGSVVADFMTGSGTTLHAALSEGHNALGCDLDPLAVLISKVRTTEIDVDYFLSRVADVGRRAHSYSGGLGIATIDGDVETSAFVDFWFAKPQQEDLRKLSKAISSVEDCRIRNAMHVAMSRIIVTKGQGASLARDASHSRPHRVAFTNDFSVIDKFVESGKRMARVLSSNPSLGSSIVFRGDARSTGLSAHSVDLVITSPPYLNAIDYLRGHKLSLVWLGYTVSDIRSTRGRSVGAERGVSAVAGDTLEEMRNALGGYLELKERFRKMVDRYLLDLLSIYAEQARVLKRGARAITVIGNSALRGSFLRNDEAAIVAAAWSGLTLESRYERELPANRRYLPPPSANNDGQLGRRMRTESVLKFRSVQGR